MLKGTETGRKYGGWKFSFCAGWTENWAEEQEMAGLLGPLNYISLNESLYPGSDCEKLFAAPNCRNQKFFLFVIARLEPQTEGARRVTQFWHKRGIFISFVIRMLVVFSPLETHGWQEKLVHGSAECGASKSW